MSKIIFFRHAQASYGAENYDVLSAHGEQQSAVLGEFLAKQNINFDKVFVGPLVRQKHTCEIVSNAYKSRNLGFPIPIALDELAEHLGPKALRAYMSELITKHDLPKRLHQEMESHPELKRRNSLIIFEYFIDRWVQDKIEVPGFQKWEAFKSQVKIGIEKILTKVGKGDTVAAFTSGGTISVITALALNMSDNEKMANMNYSVMNTSMTSFQYDGSKCNLLTFNEVPHLPKEMITFV